MTIGPIGYPPTGTPFPALDEMTRAGSAEEQIALQLTAVEMVEPYRAPSGYLGMRLSNAWLGARDWRVQLYFFYDLSWEPGTKRNLMAAAGDAAISASSVRRRRCRHVQARFGACR